MAFGDSCFAKYQYIGVLIMAWIFFGTALTIIILTSIL